MFNGTIIVGAPGIHKAYIFRYKDVWNKIYGVCEFEQERYAAVNDVYEHVHRQSKLSAYDCSLIPQLPDDSLLVITGSIHFISRFKEGLSD